jgi:hypothetical protein
VERVPTPALGALASSVWIQQVGAQPLAQRHMPHGGAEVRCVLGGAPRLVGPVTASTVVGVRLHPGVLGGLTGVPADELVDQEVAATDLWRDMARLTDVLGSAATPRVRQCSSRWRRTLPPRRGRRLYQRGSVATPLVGRTINLESS